MDVGQDVDEGGHVVPADLVAGLEVLHRVGLRVGELKHFEWQPWDQYHKTFLLQLMSLEITA